jgi:hypothetical protein
MSKVGRRLVLVVVIVILLCYLITLSPQSARLLLSISISVDSGLSVWFIQPPHIQLK